ncbi:MAG: TrbI/VirB10 family protein [Verrucomicrobiales bacterium]
MIGRIIGFFKSPAGAAILFLAGTFVFFYFVREHRERRASERAAEEAAKVNLERLGQMVPERVPKETSDPITSEWVQDNRLDKFTPKSAPQEAPVPPQSTEVRQQAPAELPKLMHFFEPTRPANTRPIEAPQPPRHFAPPGTLIPCQLIITVDSSSLNTPVVGFVTEDIWHNQNLIVPAGTEVHSFARQGRVRDRIEVNGVWRFVWHDGREVSVRGVALDRQHDIDKDDYGITDGSAGIRGSIAKTDELLEFKLFASTAISGIARNSKETTESLFGNLPRSSPGNAALEGASAVADRYADLLLDQIEGDGLFVRVPAGTEFYVYTLQVFEPKLASVAGLTQGTTPRNSWEPAAVPERVESTDGGSPTATSPSTDAVLRQREALVRALEARERAENQTDTRPRQP